MQPRTHLDGALIGGGRFDLDGVGAATDGWRRRGSEHGDDGKPARGPQRWTTGQVSVRVMPGTPWTFATTSLPSSSTLRASARTMTS